MHWIGDEPLLVELLVILLENASKYSPEKAEIILTTAFSRYSKSVIITDSGVGIPTKDLPHVFNRFYRVDQTRSRDQQRGYGLGLSLAKHIVQFHQGSIWLRSKEGQGTTVKVSI